MMQQLMLLLPLVGLIAAHAFAQSDAPKIKTDVSFTIKNAGINVEGTFDEVSTTLRWDEQAPENTTITARVVVSSINTNIRARDRHLLREDYFHAAQYPDIRIYSRSIKRKDKQNWEGEFDLTMRGITKKLTIPFSYQKTAQGGIFSAQFSLNRLDFQVGKSSWIMGDEVKVRVRITELH
ncbi:YceI family protein [Rhodoflexus sp.]